MTFNDVRAAFNAIEVS